MGARAQTLQSDKESLNEELKILNEHMRDFSKSVLMQDGMPPHRSAMTPLRTPPRKESVGILSDPNVLNSTEQPPQVII